MWYYASGVSQHGPVSEEEMRSLAAGGRIGPDTLVWTDGMGAWSPARETPLGAIWGATVPPTPAEPAASAASAAQTDYSGAGALGAGALRAGAPGAAAWGGSEAPRPLRPLWLWLRGLLIAYLIASMVMMVVLIIQIGVLEAIQNDGFSSDDAMLATATANNAFVALVALASTGVVIACIVLWLRWVYRAMKNLHVSGAHGLTISAGWAVGWYFIPIASLWMPLQVMRQIWRASSDPANPGAVPVPATIGWWWAFWIISGVLGGVSLEVSLAAGQLDAYGQPDLGAAQASSLINVVNALVDVPLVLMALSFMSRITEMQDRRLQIAAAF